MGKCDDAELAWVAAPILTHHKNWDSIGKAYPPYDPTMETPDGLDALVNEMPPTFFFTAEKILRDQIWPELMAAWSIPDEWSAAIGSDWVPADPVKELRLVLESVRAVMRKLSSLTVPAPEILAGTFVRGAIILADHSGSAWERFRFIAEMKDVERTREQLGLRHMEALYEHQRVVSDREGSAILIAPTGSGKTEAALLWAARQSGSMQGQPVVYYLLPYQASLNAMRVRLAERFGRDAIALQHSRAAQALYRQLLDKQYTPSNAETTAKRERNLASLQVKPIRVSSPYQLLKGAFQLRGHEALWTAATGALFILDEIHAYETERMAILLATLRYLCRDLGGRAFIMSATLPKHIRNVFTGLLGDVAETHADQRTLEAFCRHKVRILDAELTDQCVIDDICRDVRQGMSVLVVTTTVGRAQQMRRKLSAASSIKVELLHGRFNSDDRAEKELSLMAKRGVGARGGNTPIILVATQVVEVSLNVDFDVLYSDPAPLEALLQRFGRVNRSRLVPFRTVNVCRIVPHGCPVYSRHLVSAALSALERWNGERLREDGIEAMLDQIYDQETTARMAQELSRGIECFQRQVLSTCRPFHSDESIEELFDRLFDGYEVLPVAFEREYKRRLDEQPLLAPGLLVSITRGQYFSLLKRGRLRKEDGVYVANCRYAEQGLEIDAPPELDGI